MKDWCNNDGVCCFKEKIVEYWFECGYDVEVDLVDVGFVFVMCSVCIDVCSNMVNGMLCCKFVNVNEVCSEYCLD